MDTTIYQSPYSWRYSSPEMRSLWSEENKRRLWRMIWVKMALAQSECGLVTTSQYKDLQEHAGEVDIARSLSHEQEIHHDLMAEVRTFAEQCAIGGGIIHLGATSMDIEDNCDALRIRQALIHIQSGLKYLLLEFCKKITQYADLPLMAFTHLQPAEPTTLGYRLSLYAQDLFSDYQSLERLVNEIKGKGFKGAVGTSASYVELLGNKLYLVFESRMSELLDLPFFPNTAQTYPRKQDYAIISTLAGLGASLHKFAADIRLLQAPTIGDISEPFSSKQVGSSAMPFKQNPVHSEKICSLARSLSHLPQTAWENASHSYLERTLDDSANRRTFLPESFLIADEILITAIRIVKGLTVNHGAIQRNLTTFGPFASTERLLMILVKNGADRQAMHEQLRHHAMAAWEEIQNGRENPLVNSIANDPLFLKYIQREAILKAMQIAGYTGNAAQRSLEMVNTIKNFLG